VSYSHTGLRAIGCVWLVLRRYHVITLIYVAAMNEHLAESVACSPSRACSSCP
jgi:hypothetical protein